MRVLLGPLEAEQASALGRIWSSLGPALAQIGQAPGGPAAEGADVLVDCGRVWPGAPTGELLAQADTVLLVARPTTEGLAHARSRLVGLEQAGVEAGLVLIGEHPHRLADVGPALDAVGVRPALLAGLVDDPRAAAMLAERLLSMPGRPAPNPGPVGWPGLAHEAPPQRERPRLDRPEWPASGQATGVVG